METENHKLQLPGDISETQIYRLEPHGDYSESENIICSHMVIIVNLKFLKCGHMVIVKMKYIICSHMVITVNLKYIIYQLQQYGHIMRLKSVK